MSAGTELRITVEGDPMSKGSKTAMPGGRMIESGTKASRERRERYRAAVRVAARDAMDSQTQWDQTQAVRVSVCACLARPKSHYGAKGTLRASAAMHHAQKPDCDKILRLLLDELTGIVYRDDCQVVDARIIKLWSPGSSGFVDIIVTPATSDSPQLRLGQIT